MLHSLTTSTRVGGRRLSRIFIVCSIVLCGLAGGRHAAAQRIVTVEPDNFPAQVGNLNIAVDGDTTATGERVDENTIYMLKRDGVYWLDGTLSNSGYHLHIEAEEGEGHPPIIRPAVDLTGSSSKLFQPRGDFTIRGLFIDHITDQGGLEKNPIRVSAENAVVRIDRCWFQFEEQSWVRFDNSGLKVYITNSMGRNAGRNDGSSNGRVVDTRGNDVDTLVIENSTFYNHSGHGLRSDGGFMKYVKINHNTFVDVGSPFDFGRALEVEFTNNLFTNVGFRGVPYRSDVNPDLAVFEVTSVEEIEGLTDMERSILVANNNFERPTDELMHPEYGQMVGPYREGIQNIFDTAADSIVYNRRFVDSTAQALMDLGVWVMRDNINEPESVFNFADRPDFQTIVDFMEHIIFTPEDIDGRPLLWDNPENRIDGSLLDDWRDFSYDITSASYTGAAGGFPIGDLNWFPERLAAWEASSVSNEEDVAIAQGFQLLQNYPNPFNPTTTISFELSSVDEVTLDVFDAMGRKVRTLTQSSYPAGTHAVSFNAEDLASGLFLARLRVGSGESKTIRMLLVK